MRRSLFFVAALTGCASTRPVGPRAEVAEIARERIGTGEAITLEQDAEARARVRKRVSELLARPLTIDAALTIALLNNRGLQADLEMLGVAQADLVDRKSVV